LKVQIALPGQNSVIELNNQPEHA